MPNATIMIGIPGSGKTTWVAVNRPDAEVCSADLYFITDEDQYKFDGAQLGEAHQKCLLDFIACLDAGEDVVVDNTNTTLDQIAPYIALAQAYGYNVEVIACTSRHVDDCVTGNIHGVPERTVLHMARAQARLIQYWPPRWPTVKYA